MDVVLVQGFVSHAELSWEIPSFREIAERLGRFARVVRFDKRGMGLSDRTERLPTLEERMDDVRAVMDAVGVTRAVLIGVSEGGPMSLLFAATYPERTSALVLWDSFACLLRKPGYEIGLDPDFVSVNLHWVGESWGTGEVLRTIAVQDAPVDEATNRLLARLERNAATPTTALATLEFSFVTDVRDVLSAISAPTLVVHRAGDPLIPVALGRYLADHIRGAKYVEFPGDFHLSWVGHDAHVIDEIEEFITRARHAPEIDRVLKTVLFTDIVDSTQRAAVVGDREWRRMLGAHDVAVRRELHRFHGDEINTTGDGFLAAFDGPARAIWCAEAIISEARSLGIEVRAGLHSGECEVRDEDLAGLTVHIGARIAALAKQNEILVSRTVVDLVAGSTIEFVDRDEHELKGVPGTWRLFATVPGDAAESAVR